MFDKPKNPAEYAFAYIFPHTQATIELLNRQSLPFDPYMVTSGGLYVISGDVQSRDLHNICPIVLDVKDRKVLKCIIAHGFSQTPQLIGERKALAVEDGEEHSYGQIVSVLIRAGIAHVPADVYTLRRLTMEMATTERKLIVRLDALGIRREGIEYYEYSELLSHYWDVMIRMGRNIRVLKDQLKVTETTSDAAKAVLAVKCYLDNKDT